MKIFAAGLYHAGRSSPGSSSIHTRLTERYLYPHVLESFFYAKSKQLAAIRHNQQRIFLDSGAYSAFTQGARINLKRYADFIRNNPDIIEIASNLDVIGQNSEKQSYSNLKQLERWLGPGKVIPVHHVRDDDQWLKRYLEEGYNHLALGGMVIESTPVLKQWLDYVWFHFLTNEDGTPKVKVHGFGLTARELMFRYPWASVDSTAWILRSHFGGVLMDFPQPDGLVKDYTIAFSSRSQKRYDLNSWHFLSLKPGEQQVVRERLQQLEAERVRRPDIETDFEAELGVKLGFTPEALAKSYGLRDLGNLEYFKRAMQRGVDRFVRVQETLWD
jgi:hypothetical protein